MQKLVRLIAVMILAMAINSHGALLGYWSMNATEGETAYDGSTNHNDGTLVEGASFVTGYSGNAVSLNYDGSRDGDYVLIKNKSSLNPTTNKLTLDAWINLASDTGKNQTVLAKWNAYYLRVTLSYISFGIFDSSGLEITTGTNYTFSTGVWYHLTGVYDGVTSHIYVNSVEVASSIKNITLNTDSAKDLHIGSASWGVSETFCGMIDEVRIYDETFAAVPVTEAPVFDPAGPEIEGQTTVTISSATAGATIYYTTDGSKPTVSGAAYANPTTISVNSGTSLRAMAVGSDSSYETCQTYTLPTYPKAKITVSATTVHLGEWVTASGADSKAAAGNTISGYIWDFVNTDGSEITYDWEQKTDGAQLEHRPIFEGQYYLTLKVTDNLGNTSFTTKKLVTVQANNPPAGVITYELNDDGSVQLDASGSSDPDGDTIESYRWELPDGEVQYGLTINYKPAGLSAFGASLIITDQWGLEGQKEADVYVDRTPVSFDATVNQTISLTVSDAGISANSADVTIPIRLGYCEYIPVTINNTTSATDAIQVTLARGEVEGGDNTWITPQDVTINSLSEYNGVLELKTILNVNHEVELVVRYGTLTCTIPITLQVEETYPIFGTQEHFTRTLPGRDQGFIDIAYLTELPSQIYRLPDVLCWHIQTKNSNDTLTYDFDASDWSIPNLIDMGKTKVLPFMGYIPDWLQPLDENTDSKMYYWNLYVRTVALRYTNLVNYWESYNEPPWGGFTDWTTNGPSVMYKLMKNFYTIIKRINSSAKIVAPGWCRSDDLNVAESIIDLGGDAYVDIYNFHHYTANGTEEMGSAFDTTVANGVAMQMKELLDGHQIAKPLFVTECGGNAKCTNDEQHRRKAIQWIRTNLIWLDHGIKGIFQYEFYDYPHDFHTPSFALMRHIDHYKLPMFIATREIIRSLTGATSTGGTGELADDGVRYAVFERGSEQIICLWSCLSYQVDLNLEYPAGSILNIEDKRFNYSGDVFFDKKRMNVDDEGQAFAYHVSLAPYQVRILTVQKKVDSFSVSVKNSFLGEWLMDDLSGGTAYDSSGNFNTGSLQNGATPTTGHSGNGVLLDGTDDYILVPKSTTLISATNKLTVEAWVQLAGDTGKYQTVVAKWGNYYLRMKTTGIWFAIFDSNGTEVSIWTNYTFVPGTWYHLKGTYDSETARIYVNNEIVKEQTLNIVMNTSNTNDLHIGSASWGVAETFMGMIDEVKISDTVEAEISMTPGDANRDGAVDVGDLGILAANYGLATGATWSQGDFNGDGIVDVGDLGILAANYGTDSSGADFETDYEKVFGSATSSKTSNTGILSGEDSENTICSGMGLSLIFGLGLMGLMLLKQDGDDLQIL